MTDYAAQLLNELMGRNRDLLPDQQTKKLSYDSPEVSGELSSGSLVVSEKNPATPLRLATEDIF